MKKLTALLLTVMLIMTLSTTAFAADINATGGSDSANVTGTYVAGSTGGIVYSVDVAWGSMAFTYTGASTGTWNPTTHVYDGAKSAAWSCEDGANKITVTNHSNDAVAAKFGCLIQGGAINGAFYTDKDCTTSLTSNSLLLDTAVDTEIEKAPSGDVYFYITDGSYTTEGAPAIIGEIQIVLYSQTQSAVTFGALTTVNAEDSTLGTYSTSFASLGQIGIGALFHVLGLAENVQVTLTNQTTKANKTAMLSDFKTDTNLVEFISDSGVGDPSPTENTVYTIAMTGTDKITRTLTLTITVS